MPPDAPGCPRAPATLPALLLSAQASPYARKPRNPSRPAASTDTAGMEPPPRNPQAFRHWQQQSRRLDAMQIVFIVGPRRSGTTWLQRSLAGHPRIATGGECGLCHFMLPGLQAAFRRHNDHHRVHSTPPTVYPDADFRMILRQIYDRLLLRYVADELETQDQLPLAVVDKTPGNAQYIDLLAALYPQARFICCDRDVRDGAVSGWYFFNSAGRATREKTIEEYAFFYARGLYRPYLMRARASAARLDPPRYTELTYEDHIADPVGQIRRILRFIGIRNSEQDVRACVDAGSFRRMSGGRDLGQEDPDSPARKGIVGDWRNHFTDAFGRRLIEVSRTPLDAPLPQFATTA